MHKTTLIVVALLLLTGCTLEEARREYDQEDEPTGEGETAEVTRVIDGDTIEVRIGGRTERIRYVGVNTPERDERCSDEATAANRALVEGQQVRLTVDTSNTDRYDRLLRYVYVGDTFVNAELVRRGYAEVVSYPPDTREFENFRTLEQQAAMQGLGCHPTGIFDDGTYAR